MAKKKVDKKPKNISEAMGLQNIINNEKVDFVIGLFFVVCSIVLLIAFVSYFYTGKADQSILEDLRPGEWLNNDDLFQNKCRSLGAILSYYFITKEFGLAAFIIPFFFILIGLKMMKVYRISLWKWFLGCSLTMIWSSITLSKFLTPVMGDQVFNPGGGHGLFCVQHIENVIGTPGLIALLLITAIAFLTYLTSETINIIRKLLNPVKFLTDRIRFTVTNNEPEEKVAEQVKTEPIVEPVVEEPIKEEIREEEPAETVMLSPEITPTPTPKEKPEPAEKEDILTVEVASKTEEAKGSKLTIEEIMKTPINPKEPFTRYKYPTLSLLKKYDNDGKPQVDMDEIKATVGPTITLYEITPAEGVRISKIRNLEDDIALSLSALGIRIIAPIPGKGTIGIEVPNKKANIVSMESILNSKKFQETTMDLPLAIGKTITNEVYMVDLAKIPHLLVAGATGQGKSVGLNTIITSLLYKKHPNELKIVLVDPKKVEFSVYAPIADHFMATVAGNEDEPIITDVTKVVNTLNSLTTLMDARYDLLKIAGARNIKEYNQKFVNHQLDLTKGHEYMPYVVVIIDEYGDLIMTAGKEIELPITRIAQLARAVGIHMIIATQRPTANIITGSIKANFPGRMAFKVSSMTDSRTILDQAGANQLIGRGDMLILDGNQPVRVQCAFVDTPEIEVINKYIAEQPGPQVPLELPEPKTEAQVGGVGNGSGDIQNLDPFFEEAAHAIVISQQGSTSMIQRRFSIGYNRAGRLMDQLQAAGIVGEAQGSKPRDVLITDENSLNILLAKIRS